MTTVLILTATVGEGHDLPARLLGDSLSDESGVCLLYTSDAADE